MDEIFYCIECNNLAVDPVQLDCTHTFCKTCAESLLDISFLLTFRKDIFQCPVCSTKSKLFENIGKSEMNNS